MIQHIVLFNPKVTIPEREIRSYAKSAVDVMARSPQVARFTLGRRVVVDPGYARSFGDKTYEYAAVLEFKDESDLIGYLTSQDHGELGRLFWELCESTVVLEVEAVEGAEPGALEALV